MANRSKLTQEQVQEILTRYKSGEQVNALADEYGVSRIAISARLKRAGIRKVRRKPGDYVHQEITIDRDLVEYVREHHPNLSDLVCSFLRHLKTKEEARK